MYSFTKKKIKNTIEAIPGLMSIYCFIRYVYYKAIYSGSNFTCPICSESFNRLVDTKPRKTSYVFQVDSDVLASQGGIRKNSKCPKCLSISRYRFMYIYMQRATKLFESKCKVLHFAPEYALSKVLRKEASIDYHSGDIQKGRAMHVVDITDICFQDESFDYVICSMVLEHVTDDIKALLELKRILKPNGQAIIVVPQSFVADETLEQPVSSDEERAVLFGQKDHVRLYGKDFPNRMRKAGFEVEVFISGEDIPPEECRQYAMLIGDVIYTGRKAK